MNPRPAVVRREPWLATNSDLPALYNPDAHEAVDKAVKLGAREVTRVSELAFGERVARILDGQGHLWWIHERLVDELSRPPGGMT